VDETALARFHAKTLADDTGECIVWTAGRRGGGRAGDGPGQGYGQFWLDGTNCAAHRVAYEHWIGPIPDGMVIDHLCRIRTCVNPFHLEVVTPRENWRRGEQLSAVTIRDGKCQRGHALTPDNLYLHDGRKRCRACNLEHAKERKRRARSAD